MAEPKVRFRQDDGSSFPAWQTIPMSEVFTEIAEKNHPEMPVLSVQQGIGTVLRDSSDRNILYDKSNLKGYKAMKKDDFIIHLRSFEGGLECSNYDGISSPAYRILRPQTILPAAYRDYFRSYEFIHNKLAVSVVGIRDGKNIDMDTFWQIPMTVPCIEEQRKIADFLSSVDEVISTSEQEVAYLVMQKKALMQKIFTQEIRFKKDNGTDFHEWKHCLLGDIFVERNEQSVITEEYPLLSFTIEEGVIDPKDKKTNKRDYLMKDKDTKKFKKTELEDIIYNPSNMKFGAIHRNKLRKGLVSPIYAIFQSNIDPVFMEYVVSNPDFVKRSQKLLEGTVVKLRTLKSEAFLNMEISIPSDNNEQSLIAGFLSDFDEAISAAKKELELWKELKKGLLQQMFV